MRAKIIGLVAVVLILGSLGLYIYQEHQKREALKNVEIYLADVDVKSIGATSATLEVKLKFYNPGNTAATLDRADYSLYGNALYVGDGRITEKVEIDPGENKIVTTPFNLSYSGTLGVLWEALRTGGQITWRVVGDAYITTPLGTLTRHFDENLKVSAA